MWSTRIQEVCRRSWNGSIRFYFSSHFAPTIFFSQNILLPKYLVSNIFCSHNILLPQYLVSNIFCSNNILLPQYFAPKMSCSHNTCFHNIIVSNIFCSHNILLPKQMYHLQTFRYFSPQPDYEHWVGGKLSKLWSQDAVPLKLWVPFKYLSDCE